VSRVRLAVLGACSAVLLVGRPSSASIVVPKAGGAAHVSEVRVALASAPTRTVVWEQLVLDEARGELVWLVEVPKGGWIEGADPQWFEALDAVSAPVIAPAKALDCGSASRQSTTFPISTNPPRMVDKSLGTMSGRSAVDALVAAGYLVDATTRARLTALDDVASTVAMLHLPAGPRGQTRVVRVLGPSARGLPTILVPTGAPPLRAWAFAATRAKWIGLVDVEPDFTRLEWVGASSNYSTLLEEARTKAAGGVVTPFASLDAILADQPMGTVTSTIPSLVRAYFHADESASTAIWACAKRAGSYAGTTKVVAPTCPQPTPWTTEAAVPSCGPPPSDAIASEELACAARDDVAAALGGSNPARVWLTRWETSAVAFSDDRAIEDARRGSIPAFHEAKILGSGGCTGSDPPPSTTPPPTVPPGTGDGPSDLPRPDEPQAVVHDGCALGEFVAAGCSGSASNNNNSDSCGSSSSSSSSDSCDSGSSSSSSDSCDSGSSSSSDNGCGGSSSGGSSGGCGGGAGSSADNGCRVAAPRVRIRFSPLVYLLVACATFVRRRGRRK